MASQTCSGIHPSMFLAADWACVVCLFSKHVRHRSFFTCCQFLHVPETVFGGTLKSKIQGAWWCRVIGLANMLGDDHCFLCFAATWQNTSWITQRGLIKKEVHATDCTWGLHCNFWCWSSSSCCCGTLFFYASLSDWNWGFGWFGERLIDEIRTSAWECWEGGFEWGRCVFHS